MTKFLIIGVGGFAGAITRYLFGNYVQGLLGGASFPFGTLTVNVLGCLLIGFLFHLPVLHRTLDAELRFLLITGFLGAFTTFSTFGNETVQLLQKDQTLNALLYVSSSLGVGLAAVYLGQQLAKWIPL